MDVGGIDCALAVRHQTNRLHANLCAVVDEVGHHLLIDWEVLVLALQGGVAVVAAKVTRLCESHVDGDRGDSFAALPRLHPLLMPRQFRPIEYQVWFSHVLSVCAIPVLCLVVGEANVPHTMPMLNVLAIPDLHIPFEHPDALAFCLMVQRVWFGTVPHTVVFLGDEVDSHAISRHMPDPNGRSPRDELVQAKLRLKDWQLAFPQACVCESNHTARPWKKSYEAGLPKDFLRSVEEVYEYPISWQLQQRWILDGVVFEHGENVSGPMGALNAAKQNQASTVIGHLHSFGGAVHADSFHKDLFGLNTGCLIDVAAYAFAYAKAYRNKPTLGCGVIKHGTPYFVRMRLRADGRWNGSV